MPVQIAADDPHGFAIDFGPMLTGGSHLPAFGFKVDRLGSVRSRVGSYVVRSGQPAGLSGFGTVVTKTWSWIG